MFTFYIHSIRAHRASLQTMLVFSPWRMAQDTDTKPSSTRRTPQCTCWDCRSLTHDSEPGWYSRFWREPFWRSPWSWSETLYF